VVEKANTGEETREEAAIGRNSEFSVASRNVVTALMELKKKAMAA
jgi:hypothetical protein